MFSYMSDFWAHGAEKSGHKAKIFQVQLGATKNFFFLAAYTLEKDFSWNLEYIVSRIEEFSLREYRSDINFQK